MRNRFILLIDFSPYSEHLIRFAYDWAKKVDAEILLLHKTTVMSPVMAPHESKMHLAQIAHRDALERLHQCMESTLPKSASAKLIASERKLIYQLRNLLKEPYNHLVFLGLKGAGLLKKVFIGSEAVRVIEEIDNPIVAMPKNAVCCARETIHVAVRKSYPLNVAELSKFLNLAGSQVRKIVFFSVITQEDDYNATENYLRELVNLFSDKREDTSYELFVGRTAFEDLKRILSEKKDEFIVVQRGSRMLMDQIFRKFLINELVYEGNIPLVILP